MRSSRDTTNEIRETLIIYLSELKLAASEETLNMLSWCGTVSSELINVFWIERVFDQITH